MKLPDLSKLRLIKTDHLNVNSECKDAWRQIVKIDNLLL